MSEQKKRTMKIGVGRYGDEVVAESNRLQITMPNGEEIIILLEDSYNADRPDELRIRFGNDRQTAVLQPSASNGFQIFWVERP